MINYKNKYLKYKNKYIELKSVNKDTVNTNFLIKSSNQYGGSPLSDAITAGDVQLCKQILDTYTGDLLELLNRQENRLTPLMLASNECLTNKHCYAEICELLLEKGADPNIQNENGYNALMWATLNNCVEICSILLEKGVNPNIKDRGDISALTLTEHPIIINLLLDKGADVNILNTKGDNALMSFLTKYTYRKSKPDLGDSETTGVRLLNSGIDPNLQNMDKETALILAARCNFLTLSCKLLDMGAKPNIQTDYGTTALMEAARNGNTELCKNLLEHCADPNIVDSWGDSALHKACRYKHLETAKLLAEYMSHEAIMGVNKKKKSAIDAWGISLHDESFRTAKGVEMDDKLEQLRIYLENIINPDLK